jgi:hypothetical protein
MRSLIEATTAVYFRDVIKASTNTQMQQVNDRAKEELLRVKAYFKKNLPLISNYVKSHFVGRSNELSNWMEGKRWQRSLSK